MHEPSLRIAIVGPESCGKTTLADALQQRLRALAYPSALVPEVARQYYAQRPYTPTPADVLAIARGQLAAEAEAEASGARLLLCDSTVLTCVIWAEVAFGAAEPALQALNAPHRYALTLLPCPDIPWAPDPLRTHPHARESLLARYRTALQAAGVPAVEIVGQRQQRLELAWRALQGICPALPDF